MNPTCLLIWSDPKSRDRAVETVQKLESLGFEFADELCHQADFTRNIEIPDARLRRAFGWEIEGINTNLWRKCILDWEVDSGHDIHTSLRTIYRRGEIAERLRDAGFERIGLWNQIQALGGEPYVTDTHLESGDGMQKIAPMDFCVPNGYARFNFDDDPRAFMTRLMVLYTHAKARWVTDQLYPAMQFSVRPPGGGRLKMTEATARAMGRAMAHSGMTQFGWWFEAGWDGSQIGDRMEEAKRLAEPFLDGWNSVNKENLS